MFRTIQSHEIYLLFLNIYVYNACVYHIYVFVYSIKHVSLLYLFFHTYIYICCPDKTARKRIYSTIPLLSIIFQLVLSPIISLSFSLLPSISFNLHSLPPFSPCSLITVIWKTIEVYKRHPLMTVNALKTNAIIFLSIFEEKTSIYSLSGVALYINNKRKKRKTKKKQTRKDPKTTRYQLYSTVHL